MNVSRKPNQDLTLDVKRDAYLAIEDQILEERLHSAKLAIKQTKHLHANLLFVTENGYKIVKDICRHITALKPNVFNRSVKDLAAKIGFDVLQIGCIDNLKGSVYDPTQIVLECYAAREEGTVGDILQILYELEFHSALNDVQKHIDGFLAEVKTVGNLPEVPVVSEGGQTNYILKAPTFNPKVPAIFDTLSNVKATLKDLDTNYNISKKEEVIQQSAPQARTKPTTPCCKYVLLTFASDGATTALKVATTLRAKTNQKGYPIGVFTLGDLEDLILTNPQRNISQLLSQMDFIVPILTEGYLAVIEHSKSRSSLLDERYAHLVYDVIMTQYIANNCRNKNVRSIIPRALEDNRHLEALKFYPIFNAWRSEDDVPKLADIIVKSKKG